jgi:ubiquinone/menaquinone biosynthesis C-methylase UbiE
MINNLNKVAGFWSQYEPVVDAPNFYASPLTRPYIIETAYGKDLVADYQQDSNFAEDIFISKYLGNKKVESILSLCCGFGVVERILVSQLTDVKYCLGIDVAEGALEVAKKRAADENLHCISYKYADLNNYPWEDEKYDLVVANGALHHLSNLENVLDGIKRTLKPDGILYACEYVGPSYQDHSTRQLQIINAAAFLIPPELRIKRLPPTFTNKQVTRLISRLYSAADRENPEWPLWKKKIARILKKFLNRNQNGLDFGVVYVSPKEKLLKTDPSECVRSSEIIQVVKERFHDVEVRPFGGGILMHALGENFFTNLDAKNPLHTKCLEMLFQLERHFMDTGEISIENAFIIARK